MSGAGVIAVMASSNAIREKEAQARIRRLNNIGNDRLTLSIETDLLTLDKVIKKKYNYTRKGEYFYKPRESKTSLYLYFLVLFLGLEIILYFIGLITHTFNLLNIYAKTTEWYLPFFILPILLTLVGTLIYSDTYPLVDVNWLSVNQRNPKELLITIFLYDSDGYREISDVDTIQFIDILKKDVNPKMKIGLTRIIKEEIEV